MFMIGVIAMQEIQSVLSGFALHLASHFGRSFSNLAAAMLFRTIGQWTGVPVSQSTWMCGSDQTVSPATPQIPDPLCNMRVRTGK